MSAARESLYLCLDQGGHASRAIVVDGHGQIHAQAFRPIDTHREDGRVEHAPEQIVETLQTAAEQVVAELGDAADRIAAAGFATQRSSIVCWHRETGAALSPVISWQDTRAADWLHQFDRYEPEVHRVTGLMLSPHYGVSKLRWCLDHLPEVERALEFDKLVFGPLASYIANRMIAPAPLYADPANASRTLLWDRHAREWSTALVDLFAIPAGCLPQCVPSRYEWGGLTIGTRQIPVTIVTGDQSAALFAFGMPEAGRVYANLGTGAFLQQRIRGASIDPGRLLASVVYQDTKNVTNVIEGTINGAGSAVNATCDRLGIDQKQMRANSSRWLEDSENLPLFVNGIAGLGSPWWLPDQPSGFVGAGTPEQMIAAVLESVAFMIAVNVDAMSRVTDRPDSMLATGGLGRVAPLLQRIANLTGLRVESPQVTEATARGLAFLLAGLPEDWPAPEIQQTFEPARDPDLEDRFARWREAMPPVP